jgi:ArsR family transcriptional regulator
LQEYSEIYKLLSDPTRLRILSLLLLADEELCCCELADCLGITEYNVSRHAKLLKQSGLIVDRKDGRWVYYRLPEQKSEFTVAIMQSIMCIPERLTEENRRALKNRLKVRAKGKCCTPTFRKISVCRNEWILERKSNGR